MERFTASLMALALLVICAVGWAEGELSGATPKRAVRVMDETGNLVSGAEAFALFANGEGTGWRPADSGGVVRFTAAEIGASPGSSSGAAAGQRGRGEIIARAPGYAATVIPMTKSTRRGEAPEATEDIVLEKGMSIEFVLASPAGKTLPQSLQPSLVDGARLHAAWRSPAARRLSLSAPKALGAGRFAFQVPENPPELYLLIEAPGFLRQFQAGPFQRTQFGRGPVEVKLPEPGIIEALVHLDSGNEAGQEETTITIVRQGEKSGRRRDDVATLLEIGSRETTTVRVPDLAPDDYKIIVARRGEENNARDRERTVAVISGKIGKVELGTSGTESASSYPFPELRLVDSDGQAIPGAEVAVRKAGYRGLDVAWHGAEEGRVLLRNPSDYAPFGSGDRIEGTYEVLARAPGHGWTEAEVELAARNAGASAPEPVTITFPSADRAEIRLRTADGRPLPDNLSVSVFTAPWAEQAWWSARLPYASIGAPKALFSVAPVEKLGNGRYAVSLPGASSDDARTTAGAEGRGEFYLLVNTPGFLRGWQGGPYSLDDVRAAGYLDAELPSPVTMTVSFEPPPDGFKEGQTSYTACGLRLALKHSLHQDGKATTRWTELASAEAADIRVTTTVMDLAPGDYRLEVGGGERRDHYNGLWSGDYKATTDTAVIAGETKSLTLVCTPFDPALLTGDFTAVVKVNGAGGRTVEGKPYKVMMQTRDEGEKMAVQGTLPASGVVEIPNLRTIDQPVHLSDIPKGAEIPGYSFRVGEATLGQLLTFDLDRQTGQIRPLADGAKRKEYEFSLPPEVSDEAPDIELIDLATGATFRLSDLKGQVVFLDFWATWCGPCQEPMEHNQQIMVRRGKEWAGKAQIVGASVDDDIQTLARVVEKNKWQAVCQAWCPPAPGGGSGEEPPAKRAYAITGIPTALLIDARGRIVWRGHPSGYEVEKEIDKLIGK